MASRPRLAPLEPTSWHEDLKPLLEAGMSTPSGGVLNIFRTLAHHPKLLKRWVVFGNHILGKSSLSARERELVILRVGWLRRSEYEWGQHVLIARGCGISDEETLRVTRGPDDPGWDPFEATLLRAADELIADSRLSDATWKALSERYATEQLLDLVFTVGQYTLVAMALNTLGVERDDGVPGFPE